MGQGLLVSRGFRTGSNQRISQAQAFKFLYRQVVYTIERAQLHPRVSMLFFHEMLFLILVYRALSRAFSHGMWGNLEAVSGRLKPYLAALIANSTTSPWTRRRLTPLGNGCNARMFHI